MSDLPDGPQKTSKTALVVAFALGAAAGSGGNTLRQELVTAAVYSDAGPGLVAAPRDIPRALLKAEAITARKYGP
jgi:hypothetical protein